MNNYSFINPRTFLTTLALATALGPLACATAVEDGRPDGTTAEDLAAAKKTKARPAIAEYQDSGTTSVSVSVGVSVGSTSGAGGSGGYDSKSGSTTGSYDGTGGFGSGTTTTGVGGSTGDGSGALVLTVGKDAPICNVPNGIEPCDDWQVSITLPPSLQHTGAIPLSTPELFSFFSVSLPDEDGSGFCGGGGGSFLGGSIEILSIDASQVLFRLKGTSDDFGFDADGKYIAEICVPPPPPPPPGPPTAIAIRYGDIPVETGSTSSGTTSGVSVSSSSSGGGTTVDPDTLALEISTQVPICSDPSAPLGCGQWEVRIGLPTELQQPGTIPLSTPGLISYMSFTSADQGGGFCGGGGGGPFTEGTIEILSIDATQVTFRLADTSTWFGVAADGEYTAPRCFAP